MFKKMPALITALVVAMLFGMVAHGFELFYKVEGGGLPGSDGWANIMPFLKALGFPLAFECGNAVGLFIGFNRQTKSWWTRGVALGIGAACLLTSYLIQFHYYQFHIQWDFWYSGVLPGLVALLSALAGLLDYDQQAKEVGTAVPEKEAVPASQPVDVVALVREAQASLERSMQEALAGVPNLVQREIKEAMYTSTGGGGGGSDHPVVDVLKELPEMRIVEVPKSAQQQPQEIEQLSGQPKKSGEQVAKELLGEIFGMSDEAAQRQVDVVKAIWTEVPERDKKIVQLKADGMSNRQIAEEVGMSESGVRGVLARSK